MRQSWRLRRELYAVIVGFRLMIMSLVGTDRERNLVADVLGDTPETAIPTHLLRQGLADAYVCGSSTKFDAVIVQSRSLLHEPWCFGDDPHAACKLLSQISGWSGRGISPNVHVNLAGPLSTLIQQEGHFRVRRYGDLYHTLIGRLHSFSVREVRPLDMGDADLLSTSHTDPHRLGFNTFEDLLTDGVAAGAVVNGKLVSLAHTNAVTAGYGDIGVATDDEWRGMGLATASACIVARHLLERGKTPVWSTGEDNMPSLRVATKLGFTEESRRVYLNISRA